MEKVMDNEIIMFEEGELEIAVVTYNRCEFIAEWLKQCYEQLRIRNIHISIYDSSTNNDTADYIQGFKAEYNDSDIEYWHLDSDIVMGYKPMLPLLKSSSKYVWVSGDSRCHDFHLLDKKIFPYLKKDVDFAVIYCSDNEVNDGKIHTDKDEFLVECLYSLCCIGLSIYKTELFQPLKTDRGLRAECDRKYKNNGGLAWLGYFLELLSLGDFTVVSSWVPIINLCPDKKVVYWYKNFYGILIEDLCNLMDGISEKYNSTERAIRELWQEWIPDCSMSCYQARKHRDLNTEVIKKYKENGMLERCTLHAERMEHFANASDEELDIVFQQEWEKEREEFEQLCCSNLNTIERAAGKKEIWIYGAGSGGKILAQCLARHQIPVCGFIDQEAEKIKSCEGIPVKGLDDIDLADCFVIISLRAWGNMCVGQLMNRGIQRNQILYLRIEGERQKEACGI